MVRENEGYVRTYVTRLGRHDARPFTVNYETVPATAQSNVDYKAIDDGKLDFIGDEYEKFIDVRIYDDKRDEKDETFSIDLISTSGGEQLSVQVTRASFYLCNNTCSSKRTVAEKREKCIGGSKRGRGFCNYIQKRRLRHSIES